MTDLLALPDRELDARLAERMKVPPRISWAMRLGGAVTYWDTEIAAHEHVNAYAEEYRKRATVERLEFYPRYSDPSSPRSLLDGVEAEIKKRGLCDEYTSEIIRLCEGESCEPGCTDCALNSLATAPAKIRVAAAVKVMEAANA